MREEQSRRILRGVIAVLAISLSLSIAACAGTSAPSRDSSTPPSENATSTTTTTPSAEEPVAEAVRIRIENRADATLEDVVVEFPTQRVEYGDVEPGERTDYRDVEQAYRYAYVQVKIDGRRKAMRPVDYVGENLLEPGDYTYILDQSSEVSGEYTLTLDFRRD